MRHLIVVCSLALTGCAAIDQHWARARNDGSLACADVLVHYTNVPGANSFSTLCAFDLKTKRCHCEVSEPGGRMSRPLHYSPVEATFEVDVKQAKLSPGLSFPTEGK